jgi:hypothetical protein
MFLFYVGQAVEVVYVNKSSPEALFPDYQIGSTIIPTYQFIRCPTFLSFSPSFPTRQFDYHNSQVGFNSHPRNSSISVLITILPISLSQFLYSTKSSFSPSNIQMLLALLILPKS